MLPPSLSLKVYPALRGLTEMRFMSLRNRLEETIDSLWDTVRFYRLCKCCLQEMEFVGIGEAPKKDLVKIF